MYVCCVLSGRGLCDELITRPEESYRPWCVVVCDLEISWKVEALAHWGLLRQKKKKTTKKKNFNFMTIFNTPERILLEISPYALHI